MRTPEIPTISLNTQSHVQQASNIILKVEERFNDRKFRQAKVQSHYCTTVMKEIGSRAIEIINAVKVAMATSPYCIVIRDIQTSVGRAYIAGISAALGEVTEPCNLESSLVIRILQPHHDRKEGTFGVLSESFHTDGTDWQNPNDLTCLLCLQADEFGGGESKVMTMDSIIHSLKQSRHQEFSYDEIRNKEFLWKLDENLGGGDFSAPFLTSDSIRWLKHNLLSVSMLNPHGETDELIQYINTIIEGNTDHLKFSMRAGDLLILNNKKLLHARTLIENPEQSCRKLLRTKVLYRGST